LVAIFKKNASEAIAYSGYHGPVTRDKEGEVRTSLNEEAVRAKGVCEVI
jgi:hypothetical protein